MSDPRMCCNQPPMIYSAKTSSDNPLFTVTCLICGRHGKAGKMDMAINKFNERKK